MKHLSRQTTRTGVALLLFSLFNSSTTAVEQPQKVDAVLAVTRQAYVYLHEHPELGKKEFKAHDYLVAQLAALGLDDIRMVSALPTAIVAILDTGIPGPTIAFRAEMDARPLELGVDEPESHNPRSLVPGVMHNCGHDAHAAILLGLAAHLTQNAAFHRGKIVFIFQPAEEVAGGADDIVRDGILERLGVQAIFALHVAPSMPVGTLAVASGPSLAGSNYFKLKLKGRGSHAAAPQEGDDIPLIATRFVQELDYFPARKLDLSTRPAVVSVTRIQTGSTASNILPSEAEISGTVRTFEDIDVAPNGSPSLAQSLRGLVDRLAQSYGISYEWELRKGAPPTINDPKLFEKILPVLEKRWIGKIDTSQHRSMFAEDFSYYTEVVPSLYFSIGIEKGDSGKTSLHTVDFTLAEDALPAGVKLFADIAAIAGQAISPPE
ncbi:M20 metallopeptidase family protein [Rhizobium anhuiense]|uniref:M20 metallopeptidase family protein n=1 Tax=Rhizobium anhuiense TaxID=1184720 RepID=UPI0014416CBC|nr:M20 family metallopeptidase [Rhizobium anhuiense]